MKTVNKVQLIGELKNTPEISVVNGMKIARFMLSTCDFYRVNGRLIVERQWHNIVAIGQQAILIQQNFCKGDEVIIDGSISQKKSFDRFNNEIITTEVIAKSILFPFVQRA